MAIETNRHYENKHIWSPTGTLEAPGDLVTPCQRDVSSREVMFAAEWSEETHKDAGVKIKVPFLFEGLAISARFPRRFLGNPFLSCVWNRMVFWWKKIEGWMMDIKMNVAQAIVRCCNSNFWHLARTFFGLSVWRTLKSFDGEPWNWSVLCNARRRKEGEEL